MNEDRSKVVYILGIIGVVVLVAGIVWLLGRGAEMGETEALDSEMEVYEFDPDETLDEMEPPIGLEFDDETSTVEGGSEAADTDEEGAASPSTAGEALPPVEVAMDSGMFFFAPETIRAKVGQKVIVHITARGMHDFVIDELGVREATPDGETVRIEFTPTAAGEFEYYCSVASHRQRGQVGTLIVEEA